MLGHTHATTTAAAAAAVGLALHVGAPQEIYLAAVAGGASLLPDCDVDGVHEQSTFYSAFGPPGKLFCKFVNRVSGGHRHATHWPIVGLLVALFFVLVPLGLVDLGEILFHHSPASQTWVPVVAQVPPSAFLGALAISAFFGMREVIWRVLKVGKHGSQLLAAIAVGCLTYMVVPGSWWLPGLAVAIGYLGHIAGDCIFGRCELAAPLSDKWIGNEHLTTGHLTDKVLGAVMLPVTIWIVLVAIHFTASHATHELAQRVHTTLWVYRPSAMVRIGHL